MVRFEENLDKDIPYDIISWVGLELEDNSRGIVLYIGDGYHIIGSDTTGGFLSMKDSNMAFGGLDYTGETVKETVNKWEQAKLKASNIKYIYSFNSYKEMMTWFVDGIK